jgi:hypothetical protein
MLCWRIAAGGLALLSASVVNASPKSCPLPWACRDSPPSAERVEPKARDANSTQNVKNLPSPRPNPRRLSAAESQQQLALRRLNERGKMLDQEKAVPLFKELRQGQQQENQSSTATDQPARDALFDEFLRWQVHQVLGE